MQITVGHYKNNGTVKSSSANVILTKITLVVDLAKKALSGSRRRLYRTLHHISQQFEWSNREIARKIGKDEKWVRNNSNY